LANLAEVIHGGFWLLTTKLVGAEGVHKVGRTIWTKFFLFFFPRFFFFEAALRANLIPYENSIGIVILHLTGNLELLHRRGGARKTGTGGARARIGGKFTEPKPIPGERVFAAFDRHELQRSRNDSKNKRAEDWLKEIFGEARSGRQKRVQNISCDRRAPPYHPFGAQIIYWAERAEDLESDSNRSRLIARF